MRLQPTLVRLASLAGLACLTLLVACGDDSDTDMAQVVDLAVADDKGTQDMADLAPPDLANVDQATPLFQPAVSYAADTGPIFLAAADVNKDNQRDLIVVSTNDPDGADDDIGTTGDNIASTIGVLLGNGDGTFQPVVKRAISAYPYGIATANLDGDANPDAVVATADGYDVLLGNGDGTFGTPAHQVVANYVRSVALGDLDGDGNLDLVLADLGDSDMMGNPLPGKVWTARGNGAGGFGTAMSHNVSLTLTGDVRSPQVVKLGDMNADGKLDVVTCNQTPTVNVNTVSILTNSSTSGAIVLSATPTEITTGKAPWDVVIAQLDGANKLDLVIANFGDDQVTVFLSDTAGSPLTFGAGTTYAAGKTPIALALGDIDSDTKMDLIAANADTNAVTVIYGAAGGVFNQATATRPGSEPFPVGTNPISLVAAPFNADVKVDVATANQVGNSVSVLINNR